MKRILIILPIIILMAVAGFWILKSEESSASYQEVPWADAKWDEYLGGPHRNHYSTLDQITADNVGELEVAWQYHTKDTGQMQTNAIIVDTILYGVTATMEPFALNAATGEEYWRIKSEETEKFGTLRGVTYWENEAGEESRILYTNGEWLYAVDARTGEKIASFGKDGRVSLKTGIKGAEEKMVISTTPGTIYRDVIIMPLRVTEGSDAALGHIQAFNVKTGKLAWVFHTIPQPGEEGYETWPEDTYTNTTGVGGANNWAGMAIDRERGIVYAPTGSAAYDFYGANRKGSNLYANSLLALDAATGERIWHFQFVHHDILDRDPPAPPNLMTVTHQGKKVDAVAQITKQGFVFLFNRVTGEPLFPIEERPVPISDIPGEHPWPTQPFPTKPEPFARQTITEEDISPYAENRDELLKILRERRSEGPFTPLSEQGTLVYPGLDGGAEWGGAAVDLESVIYINSNEMAWDIGLGPTASQEELDQLSAGHRLYTVNCIACHGAQLEGNPESGFPSLVGMNSTRTKEEVIATIVNGKGMMPAFKKFSEEEREALVAYIFEDEREEITKEPGLEPTAKEKSKISYEINSFGKFLDNKGYPGIRPPWGTLNAIDLNTGEYLWKIPYGEYPSLMEEGHPITGSESYGGPVVTASGLLFIAGTKDSKIRAYDKTNGELLWEAKLPAAAFATPSVYEVNGKQYLVVACGGTKLDSPGGDSYVAFALPEKKSGEKKK